MKKVILFIVVLLIGRAQVLPQTPIYSSGQEDKLYKELAQSYTLQGKEMSKEEEERLLKNISAELRSKLEEIKKLNKNKYYQLLRSYSFSVSYGGEPAVTNLSSGNSWSSLDEAYKERIERSKKQKELEIEVELFVLKYKNADGSNQPKIKSELQSALNQLFELREAQKQEEVKSLEKRLQELKESLQVRKQKRDEIVQRRVQELLGDSRYLKWD
jgi:hypothetical protein